MNEWMNHLIIVWNSDQPTNKRTYPRSPWRKDAKTLKARLQLDYLFSKGINACSKNNGNCSHMCIPSPNLRRFCACPEGMTPTGNDLTRCHVETCKDGEFKCGNGYCIDQSSVVRVSGGLVCLVWTGLEMLIVARIDLASWPMVVLCWASPERN